MSTSSTQWADMEEVGHPWDTEQQYAAAEAEFMDELDAEFVFQNVAGAMAEGVGAAVAALVPEPEDVEADPKEIKQTVRWAFTYQLNKAKPMEEFMDIRDHFALAVKDGKLGYALGALEYCPTTNQPHIQGYLEFPVGQKKRLLGVTRFFTANIGTGKPHVEAAVRAGKTNRAYCLKLGTANPNAIFFEYGEIRPAVGERNKVNWADTLEMARRGEFDAINPQHQVCYWQNLQRIHFSSHGELTDSDKFMNFWITGAPGVGKSRLARAIAEHLGLRIYFKDAQNKWFDDYRKEPVVVLDDMEKDAKYQGHLLKTIADRYPCRVEIKGASTYIRPTVVIVTSNYFITDIFEDEALRAAVNRRFRTLDIKFYPEHQFNRVMQAELGMITVIGPPALFAPAPPPPTAPTFALGSAQNPIEIDED